jgi:hypothetical protein
MAAPFTVRTEPRFDRLAKALRRQHRDFTERYKEAIAILREDPYNRSGTHPIKKLVDVRPGEGQYRLRLRRWRFRYDVRGQDVVLQSCGLRDEKTYR